MTEKPQTTSLSDKRKECKCSVPNCRLPLYLEKDVREKIGDFNKELKGILKTWHIPITCIGVLMSEIDKLALKHFGRKLL